MKWLIIKVKAEEGSTTLEDELQRQGIEFALRTFKDVYTGNIPYSADDEVFLFAPLLSCQMLHNKYGWLNWLPMDKLKCSTYYPYFDSYIAQENYQFVPARLLYEYWDKYIKYSESGDGRLFVRPDANNKRFTGDVFNRDEFKSLLNGIEPDCLCVAAKPIRVIKEWRVLMVDGEPITGSTYSWDQEFDKYEEMPNTSLLTSMWLQANVNGYESLPRMIHFDICQKEDGKLYLMEISSVNSAGIYEMNVKDFVTAVHKQGEKEYRELYD